MDTCFHLVKQSCIFSRNGDGEEALAKRLHEAQTEILALQKERDSLKRILRDRESAEGKVLVDTGEKLGDISGTRTEKFILSTASVPATQQRR